MEYLFQETTIKSLTLANRFVRSATWMAVAAPGGACTEALYRCYEKLAGGEIGLIISGFAFVSREGQGPEGQLGIHTDKMVDGLRNLVERVHAKGGRIAAQIVHCGNQSKQENNGDLEVIGPSDRFDDEGCRTARAMTVEEIGRVVEDFGAAAERAKAAGFDAVQLHYAHGYLGSQFLSPRHNQRTDDYGGSQEKRLRFLLETCGRVREALGGAYPLMAKLNLEDFLDGGLRREEGLLAALALRDHGLDVLEVSGGTAESGKLGPARRFKEPSGENYFLENAKATKQATGMPVMMVGGLRSPEGLAEIHRETGIDYFSMSRPFIREPHLVNRWKKGDLAPAACVSCSGCFGSVKQGRGIFCVRTKKARKTGN